MRGIDGTAVFALVLLAVAVLAIVLGSGASERSLRQARRGRPAFARPRLGATRSGNAARPALVDPGPTDFDGGGHVGCGTGGSD
jgi:hypothetical protein